jgi:replicative DNA helicase
MDAEMTILACMMLDKDVAREVVAIIGDKPVWVEPKHYAIYSAIRSMLSRDRPIDAICVKDELRATDQLDGIGGAPYLGVILSQVPSARGGEYYAREYVRFREGD